MTWLTCWLKGAPLSSPSRVHRHDEVSPDDRTFILARVLILLQPWNANMNMNRKKLDLVPRCSDFRVYSLLQLWLDLIFHHTHGCSKSLGLATIEFHLLTPCMDSKFLLRWTKMKNNFCWQRAWRTLSFDMKPSFQRNLRSLAWRKRWNPWLTVGTFVNTNFLIQFPLVGWRLASWMAQCVADLLSVVLIRWLTVLIRLLRALQASQVWSFFWHFRLHLGGTFQPETLAQLFCMPWSQVKTFMSFHLLNTIQIRTWSGSWSVHLMAWRTPRDFGKTTLRSLWRSSTLAVWRVIRSCTSAPRKAFMSWHINMWMASCFSAAVQTLTLTFLPVTWGKNFCWRSQVTLVKVKGFTFLAVTGRTPEASELSMARPTLRRSLKLWKCRTVAQSRPQV